MGRVLLLIVGFVVALGLGASSPPQRKAGEQASHAGEPQQRAPEKAAAPKADDPERLYAACDPGERNSNSDLCAQWYAADSAYEASIWTRRTGWMTGIGVVIGTVTMGAAIAAAIFAALASEHTKTGARIAKNGLDHAREIAAQEMRPWLTILIKDTEARMDQGRFGFDLDLKIQNVGKFPARDIRARGRLFVNDAGQMTPAMEAFINGSVEPHRETKMVILPGDDYETNIQVSSLLGDLDIVEREKAFIDVILIVKVVYGWVGAATEGQINRCYIPSANEPGAYSGTQWHGERLHLSYFRPTWPIHLKDRHYTTMT